MEKLLKNYDIIITEDGSQTLFSHEFSENCHSISGAKSETQYNFIDGCKIKERLQSKSQLNILEVGFGTGLGPITLMDELRKLNFISHINFTSLEKDHQLIEYFFETMKLTPIFNDGCYSTELGSNGHIISLKIILGDAREVITKDQYFPNKYDAIFQDPFSPKKCPSLWTREWFEALKKRSSLEVILSTYSASLNIRKSLIEAGWIIEKRKGFGQKRSSTRAYLRVPECPLFDIGLHKEVLRSKTEALRDEREK